MQSRLDGTATGPDFIYRFHIEALSFVVSGAKYQIG